MFKRAMFGAVTAAVVTLGLTVATPANAAQGFAGFDINSASISPLFTFSQGANPTSITDDTLSSHGATVDLSTSDGVTVDMHLNANFDFDAHLVDTAIVSSGGIDVIALTFAGTFSFTENGTGDLIFQGTFNQAIMSMVGFSGIALSNSGLYANTSNPLEFSLMLTNLPNTLVGPQDFFYTATNFQGAVGPVTYASLGNGEIELSNFTFGSSFSATSTEVPEPATLALMGLAGLTLISRRRKA